MEDVCVSTKTPKSKSSSLKGKTYEEIYGVEGAIEQRRKRGISMSRARKNKPWTVQNCNCAAHNYFRQPSLLAWDAYDLLLKDFRVVIPEMRFGRYSVDFLLAEEWLGIEIDGPFHKGREARDAKRDAELLEKFDLPIVRLSKKDIYQ